MINVADLWFGAIHDVTETLGTARRLPPLILGILLLPCLLALLWRSVTALVLTALLAAIAVPIMRDSLQDPNRWLISAMVTVAALIGVAQAYLIRQARRRLREQETRYGEVQCELNDLRSKYDSEVQWRTAAERLKTQGASDPQTG